MKKFNTFSEALLVTLNPKSDSVGPVEQCPCQQQDMMSAAAQDVLKNLGGDVMQPDDDVGEAGEIQADGDDNGGVELECTGDGLRVKFNGMEIVLPSTVIDAIKSHTDEGSEDSEGKEGEGSDNDDDDDDDVEVSGSASPDVAKKMFGAVEDDDDDDDEDDAKPVTESKKVKEDKKGKKWTPPWLKNKKDKDEPESKNSCSCKPKFGKAKK